jgi:hypothetical protein
VSGECPRNTFPGRSSPTGRNTVAGANSEHRSVSSFALPTQPKDWVREPDAIPSGVALPNELPIAPAHLLNRLLGQLNKNWRVVCDPLQWILQQRKGNPRKKNSGWRDRSFCRTREGLLRSVRDYCGDIDPAAFAMVDALPDHYEDWRAAQNLDVRGTDQVPAGGRADSLFSQDFEGQGIDTDGVHSASSPTCLVMRSPAQSDTTS